MKKLMFVAAIAAMAGSAFCIESANTVGYASKAVTAGTYYLIGVQFNDAASATKGSISMNSLIGLSSEITAGTYASDFADTPEILVLKASGGYEKYYYISDATDDNDDELGYDCWADMDGYELKAADNLVLGKGFWFKSPKYTGTISIRGEVTAEAEKVASFPNGTYEIIANPLPMAFSFANVTVTGITPGLYDADFAGAAEILTLKASGGYEKFYYISDATDSNDDPVGYNCWADMDGYILEGNQVQAGESFWIKGNAAGTMGF